MPPGATHALAVFTTWPPNCAPLCLVANRLVSSIDPSDHFKPIFFFFFFSPPYCILPPPIFLPPSSLPSLFSSFLLSSLNYRKHWAKMGFWYHCNSPDPGQLICPSAVDSFHTPLSLPCSQLSHPCFDRHKWTLCLGQDILFYFIFFSANS